MSEECRNCRFSKTKAPSLVCRRYPPKPNGGSAGVFPWVVPNEWCGEWMAMRPGAGLPADIAPRPSPPSFSDSRRVVSP